MMSYWERFLIILIHHLTYFFGGYILPFSSYALPLFCFRFLFRLLSCFPFVLLPLVSRRMTSMGAGAWRLLRAFLLSYLFRFVSFRFDSTDLRLLLSCVLFGQNTSAKYKQVCWLTGPETDSVTRTHTHAHTGTPRTTDKMDDAVPKV